MNDIVTFTDAAISHIKTMLSKTPIVLAFAYQLKKQAVLVMPMYPQSLTL